MPLDGALAVAYPWVMSWINRAIEVAERQRIPQSRLAEAAGVERARISRWKAGSGSVSLHQAAKIAALLGVSLDWLVAEDVATGALAPAPTLDRDSDAILRVIRSLGLSPTEAIRRLATGGPERADEPARILAVQRLDPRLLGNPQGEPAPPEGEDPPSGRKAVVRKR